MAISTVIPESLAGDRVDRVVALLTGHSRSKVAALIEQGGVVCGGEVVESAHRRVAAGDLLEVEDAAVVADELPMAQSDVEFAVVYDDAAIIVVNKPAGLVVHPGAGHQQDTLVSGLLARFPDLSDAASMGAGTLERPGIVHRLDKETSGLLVVARTPEAFDNLVGQLKRREMGRTYVSLVAGHLSADEGTIDAPIGRSERKRTAMAVMAAGKPARTHYLVQSRFSLPIPASLIEVHLETGRTHQIRVHFAAIDHPVVGDVRYQGARSTVSPRPFLHAEHLELIHPVTEETMSFSAPLPDDLAGVLAQFS